MSKVLPAHLAEDSLSYLVHESHKDTRWVHIGHGNASTDTCAYLNLVDLYYPREHWQGIEADVLVVEALNVIGISIIWT